MSRGLSRSRTSLHRLHPRSYTVSNDKVVYIHEPRRDYIEYHDSRILRKRQSERRRSCINRLCVGVCNFFNRVKAKERNHKDNSYPPPAICYVPSRSRTLRPRGRTPRTAAHDIDRPLTRMSYDVNYSNEYNSGPERDFIIYVPGQFSRCQLGKTPMCRAGYEPIIIRTCHSERCAECSSRMITVLRFNSQIRQATKEKCGSPNTIDHTREVSCASASTTTAKCGPPRLPRRRKTNVSSCCSSKEALNNIRGLINLPGGNTHAYGDSGDIKGTLDEKPDYSEGRKKVFLYIPTTNNTSGIPESFKVHEKTPCFESILNRHDMAVRNRQRRFQEMKDRLQTFSSIWTRRRMIGGQKKKLAKDNKLVCAPPNMLESRFHHIHWLGNGEKQNNSVGRYFDKEENRVVALKIFSDKPFESTIDNLDNKLMAIQEISSLKSLDHKNIVKLLGYFELHDKYHLILESCDHSLRSEIDDAPSGLGTSVSKKIVKYVLNGLHFCHQAKCLHRDLTPENILMCKNGIAKIADFDRSIFLTDGLGNISPTPGSFVYNSPEILAGDKEYGLPSDVWSLGIIFCELLTGKPPWNGKNAQSQLREIHNCVGPLLPRHASVAKLQVESCTVHNHAQLQQMFTTISAPCCSFIMKCLDVNPLCRFTCGELLQHQFIKGNYK